MTNDMISRLMAAGLTKQQATSVTAEALVNLFMPDDGKILLREAQGRVKEMEATVVSLRKDYYEMKKRIEGVSDTLLSITQAQDQYGTVTDPKAQNILALYGALMTMNEKKGVPAAESAASIGYIMYAYLGGQAKRDVNYNPIEE